MVFAVLQFYPWYTCSLVVAFRYAGITSRTIQGMKEYKEVQREKVADPDILLVCDESNIFKWTALIKGPSETPYEDGVFQLTFAVPEQ
ncbi:PREDICTED: protein PEROXIN-4-like [Tarenaya hassleriana]|uniref:protein PEROXIN-4-like n=1 Tax=Tarenaya hassleriana TaxID=28532 RepID=UPI00053C117E|nr:PREDICTED: protein PEROXIN-4-like [Tarenaya hassleriana]